MAPHLACYLYKRARSSGRNWKKRWFVFEEHLGNWAVNYYKDEKSYKAKKKVLGTVGLETANHNASVMPVVSSKEHSLEILPADGTPALVVAAEDSVRYAEILEHLNAFAHRVFSGFLWKRARKSGRNWRKRWFQADFTSRVIRIYEDMGAVSKPNKKGTVGNANDTLPFNHKCTVHSSGLRKHCLELQFGDGELSLFVAAEDHEMFVKWRTAFETLVTGGGHGIGDSSDSSPTAGGESVASQLLKTAASREELVKTLSRHGSALLSFANTPTEAGPRLATSTPKEAAVGHPAHPPPGRQSVVGDMRQGPPRGRRGRGPPKRISRAPGPRPPPPLPSAAARKSMVQSRGKGSRNSHAPKPGRGGLLDSITGFGGGLKHVSPRVKGGLDSLKSKRASNVPSHLQGLTGGKTRLKSSKRPRRSQLPPPSSTTAADSLRARLQAHRTSVAGGSFHIKKQPESEDDDFDDDSDDFLSD